MSALCIFATLAGGALIVLAFYLWASIRGLYRAMRAELGKRELSLNASQCAIRLSPALAPSRAPKFVSHPKSVRSVHERGSPCQTRGCLKER